jgi:transposase-like protein
VAYPPYIRDKALQLRVEQQMTIDQIAERLAVSRTTAYEWVGHLPVPRRENPHPGTLAMQERYRRERESAYQAGRAEYAVRAADPTFRDFVTLLSRRGRSAIATAWRWRTPIQRSSLCASRGCAA